MTIVTSKLIPFTLSRLLLAWLAFLCLPIAAWAQNTSPAPKQDTTKNQSYQPNRKPTFQPTDRYGDPFSNISTVSPLYLKDPNQMKLDVEIDTALNYTIYEKIGNLNYRPTSSMSFAEFKQYQDRQQLKSYWQGRSRAQDGESAVSERGLIPKIYISPVFDRIFGGNYVELVPRGFVTLDFGGAWQRINNPNINIRQQKNGGFEFDQQINMSVIGKIGEKLSVSANFDNNNSFDFQNSMKVEYTGFKEDILQKLEIGNVSLPLNNTLIQGAQNLFGVKAKLQFGKVNVTAIATTQRGKSSSINVGGGGGGNTGQGRPFDIIASNYDDNRHFFLGHYFRNNYSAWIANPPQINSGINITRVEVYIINRNNETQTLRNMVGLMDLGEGQRIYNTQNIIGVNSSPNANAANNLFADITAPGVGRDANEINATLQNLYPAKSDGTPALVNGTDFEKLSQARKLAATEYTFHKQLGYITLTRKLQTDEALAVAYEYTYNGRAYKVGELSEDYATLKDTDVGYLKLLRPRQINIRDDKKVIIPSWDLMMKNIYNLNVNQLTREGFQLRIIYRDDRTGIDNPQLQDGSSTLRNRQLIEILGLDQLNAVNDLQRDGNFDFIEGITINTTTGLIIFPSTEPFSQSLKTAFATEPTASTLIKKYSYDTLYHTTKAEAELYATKNKFWIKGLYNAGSSKEILIPGFGLSQGSVQVFSGGVMLNELTDYVVDYTFGKVTILNESYLNSDKKIEVKFEQTEPFAFQTKSLLGTRIDYRPNDDVSLGTTVLYYNERPQISRNQIGTEPARNWQYGADFNINKKSRLLTKIIDALPIIQTKEVSTVNVSGEFAQLIPGTSNVIDGEGTAYLDDFENSATPYSLSNAASWKLASTPKTENNIFDLSGGAQNNLASGYRRAKLAWYTIDNQFYRNSGPFKPENITESDLQNHYVRPVSPQEIFPYRDPYQGNYYEQIFDVAYYPSEPGPYNYNTTLQPNGLFSETDARKNWGGITSAIRTEIDFDKANIEYIEFWMLDPFISGTNGLIDDGIHEPKTATGGKLIFQLGNVSEDVARDGLHAFENGLPPEGDLTTAKENNWGYVADNQIITTSFSEKESERANQDVGFDGLPNENEVDFFSASYLDKLNGTAKEIAKLDPSHDNFVYFLDSKYDEAEAQLLQRYKNINGQDGNSPIITGSDEYTPSGSSIPDNEDLNTDNTLGELEAYYEYNIDLIPGQLAIGKQYIVDALTTKNNNAKEDVTWYLFRIPVRQAGIPFGGIEGFKSMKYTRMILTGFKDPVVLRLATFRLVGSRWRRYTRKLLQDGFVPTPEITPEDFVVSTVGLEENGGDKPTTTVTEVEKTPYRIPPGVVRDRDNSSAVPRELNEQSIQVCVDELADGDARAIYKNVSVDLFNYGHIKMYFHANSQANDDEMRAFLRLGTDYDQNFYEIEINLKITKPANTTTPSEIWPEANEIDLDLSELYALKEARDRGGYSLSQSFPVTGPKQVGRHFIRILGRPDLSSLQLMMIGVKNPRTTDKRSHSVCIWADELRVTDFNRTPGWAVNATLSAKLADFATVTGAYRHSTFGFGGVSSKIFERTRDESTSYDISTLVNVDKLIPGNSGIKIPMFLSYQNTTINPGYDPANPDIKLDALKKSFSSETEQANYLKLIQDREVRRSMNFVNVRKVKVRPDAKSHIYDIENFSLSYSYSDRNRTNFTTHQSTQIDQRGSIAYTFSPKATGIEPFKNSKALNSPWLKLIKDFNFSLMPSTLAVRFDLDNSFGKTIYRNDGGSLSTPNFLKYFTFNRQYNLRWNITKALTLEYASRAAAIIDQPEGDLDTQQKKDSVINNLKHFGRMKNFDQNITLNYTIPFDKIPLTDWIGADYRYLVNYNWRAGTFNKPDSQVKPGEQDLPDSLDFKNTISNSNEQNISGRIDLTKLYNKVKFLKELNTPPKPVPTRKSNNPTTRPAPDTVKTTPPLLKGIAKLLMSVKSINGSYSVFQGTILPGYTGTPKYLGMDKNWNSPGWGFVLGDQDPNIRYDLASKGFITKNSTLTMPFSQTRNTALNMRANIEPSPDLKIQVDIKKESTNSYQEIFRFNSDSLVNQFESLNPNRSGSYRISYVMIKTAFQKSNNDIESSVFQKFEENLEAIKERFRFSNNNGSGELYDSTTQDVLIPAFIAAYGGKDVNTIGLTPFQKTPLPNWRLDYTGLSKLNGFKNIFQSVTISHAYQSSYSVLNYSNSLEYDSVERLGIDHSVEDYNSSYFGAEINNKLVPVYVISQVLMSEQFSPLIGISVRTKSKLTASVQYKTKRDLALNISNAQITEVSSKDISFEMGYTKAGMKLPFKSQGRLIVLKNDLTFRLNVTVSDTKTIQRRIDELNVITNGNLNYQMRPNINYTVSQKLSLQMYYERTINDPAISSSYRRSTTRFGVQVRFSLAQ